MSDTNTFWENNIIGPIVHLSLKQVVLKDMEEPFQPVRPWALAQLSGANVKTVDWKVVELAPNKFSSREDYIGLFESEPESKTFFSLEKI